MMDYAGWVVMNDGVVGKVDLSRERDICTMGGVSLVFGGEFPSGLCQIIC